MACPYGLIERRMHLLLGFMLAVGGLMDLLPQCFDFIGFSAVVTWLGWLDTDYSAKNKNGFPNCGD